MTLIYIAAFVKGLLELVANLEWCLTASTVLVLHVSNNYWTRKRHTYYDANIVVTNKTYKKQI